MNPRRGAKSIVPADVQVVDSLLAGCDRIPALGAGRKEDNCEP
jgi:hypothetical protein